MPTDATDPVRIIAGAMSGTSADGVDVAITRIEGRGAHMEAALVRHHHRPYEPELRSEIFSFRGGEASTNLARLARLGRNISITYAAAINEALAGAHLSASDLSAIACHGQTLYHAPPDTIQWFDPALVAAEVGCAVVSDFRRADCAAGGQGAPLVPFADYALFRHETKNRVLLNIGGIANLTILPAGATMDQLIALDTGPGNCVSDHLARRFDPTGPGYDEGGKIAQCGSLDNDLQAALRECPYFKRFPPKSTDGPEMIMWFDRSAKVTKRPFTEDLMANAAWWTGWSILREVPESTSEIIVSGGGTRNDYVMTMLRRSGHAVLTTDDLGIPSDAKEAIAFALLGAATLDGIPSNVPSVTGAKRPVVLGSITPKP